MQDRRQGLTPRDDARLKELLARLTEAERALREHCAATGAADPSIGNVLDATGVTRERIEKITEYPQVSDANAAAHFRALVESVGTVLWTADLAAHQLLAVSTGVESLLGAPSRYWLEDPDRWLDAIPPDDREQLRSCCEEAARTGEAQNLEHRMIARHGEVVWVRQIIGVRTLASGAVRVDGVMFDITRRRNAENALRESEERFRQITENINEVFWVTDASTNEPLYVSPAFEPMFGWSEKELIDEPLKWAEAIHPLDRERVLERMRSIQHGRPYAEEMRIVRPDGEVRWIHSRGFPVFDERGEVYRVVGVAEDITDRRAAEAASRRSDERFEFVARATTDVLWDWDIITQTIWWSDGFRTQLGYPENGVLPESSWIDNMHPEDREWVTRSVGRALEQRHPSWFGRYRFRRNDGTYIHVLDRAYVLFNQEGEAIRMLGAMVDVSRQQQLESQLEQMKRVSSLGTMAANMAHEFNNVLMGIQPFADVIRRLVPDQTRVQDAVGRINQSIARGRRVTDEILRFTRRVEPSRSPVLVRDWLEDFREEAEALLEGRLRLDMTIDPTPLLVHIDVAQMNQVLSNLIINARDVSPEGGIIAIRAGLAGRDVADEPYSPGLVHITVEDSGPGIAAELLDRVFEPLFTTKKSGSGLGLAISHHVVTAHDGRLYAENVDGGGARFHVLLPLAVKDEGVTFTRAKAARALPARVLIVDDEVDVAAGLEALLLIEGVDVRMVHTGGEAMTAFREHQPDAVLLDIALPDVSGTDVYRQIATEKPEQRVIFMSGHSSRADIATLLEKPQVSFLHKPFTHDELLSSLTGAVRG